MDQATLSFLARYDAPPAVVYSVLLDHGAMGAWSEMKATVIASRGDGGVGTVRRVRIGPLTVDEEVVVADVNRRIVYRVIRGLPLVRFHRGEILLEPWGSGTSLTWEVTLVSRVPGVIAALRPRTRDLLNDALRRLGPRLAARPIPRRAPSPRHAGTP